MKDAIMGIVSVTMKWFSWIAIVGMMFMIGTLLYWHLYPYKVIEVREPAKVLNAQTAMVDGQLLPTVKRGGVLSFKLEYTKHIPVTARVRRQLVNDRTICLMEGAGQAKMGENSVIIDVMIPPNMFPGKYRLQTFYEYDVNPIRSLKYEYYTEWFEVLP